MTGWLLLQAVYLGWTASELAAVVGKGGGAVVGRRGVGLAEGAVAAVAHGARAGDAAWALGGDFRSFCSKIHFQSTHLKPPCNRRRGERPPGEAAGPGKGSS